MRIYFEPWRATTRVSVPPTLSFTLHITPIPPDLLPTQEFCSALSFASVQLIQRSEKCG
jgi:hypothetical protein